METSIRFLRVEEEPVKTALCFRGKKKCYAVINLKGRVRVISDLSPRDHDLSYPVTFQQGPYPIPKIVEHFRKMAVKGLTQRADYFLTHALNGGVNEDDPLPPDTVVGEAPEAARNASARCATPRERPFKDVNTVVRAYGSPKPVRPPSEPRAKPAGPSRTSGSDVIRKLAAELKLEPSKLRKFLRSKGLKAPYDDETKIRGVLK